MVEIMHRLFSSAMDAARREIVENEYFKPFILAIKNDFELVIYTLEEEEESISDFIRKFVGHFTTLDELVAFGFVQLTQINMEENEVTLDAISIHLESKEGEAINATQCFGKDEGGQWVFAETDACQTQSILM